MSGLTMVTCLFDIGRRENNPRRKSVEHYLDLSKTLLRELKPYVDDVVVYCDSDLTDKLPHSISCSFEHLPAWEERERIEKARVLNPLHRPNEVKDTPLYAVFQRAKYQLLERAVRNTSSHVVWIDIGIGETISLEHAHEVVSAARRLSKVQLTVYAEPQPVDDWRALRGRLGAGFIAGPKEAVASFCKTVEESFSNLLERGYAPHDEAVLEHLVATRPGDFIVRNVSHHGTFCRTPDVERKRPKICLNMIVKNESRIIERCLASVAPWIDCFAILDTGSTDGTQEIIRDFMTKKGVYGFVAEGSFENFSQARNLTLKYAKDSPLDFDYFLLCDADMELVVDEPDWRSKLEHGCYHVRQVAGISYDNVRLLRRDVDAAYVGPTHEYLGGSVQPRRLEGIRFIDHAEGSSRKEKFERDERLLREELERNPGDARSMFYLAQTLKDVGDWSGAIGWYEKRIQAGGWAEEVWYAQYMKALCAKEMNAPNVMVEEALKAHEMRPTRAEPMYLLAKYFREKGENEKAMVFVSTGETIPYPKDDQLFVEDWVYSHGFKHEKSIAGFYAHEWRNAGRQACFELTTDKTAPCWAYDTARRNSVHYARTAAEAFEGRVTKTFDSHRDGYIAMNPSVWVQEANALVPFQKLYAVVRTVNYTIADDGRYILRDEKGYIRTENYLTCDGVDKKPIVDSVRSSEGRTDFCVQGYEDMRLFRWQDAWWASCTVRDRHPEGLAEIALLELTVKADHVVVEGCHVQRQVRPDLHQKNWMPFLEANGDDLIFLYTCDPTVVLFVDPEHKQAREMRTLAPEKDLRALRGSSQGVELALPDWDSGRIPGRLFVVHESIDGEEKRTYLHRLIWMRLPDYKVELVSDPFVFEHKGIEFCCGLARVGNELLFSYGVEDREAKLVSAPTGAVKRFLKGG